MGLDAITNLLPKKGQTVFAVIAAGFSIILFAILMKQGMDTVLSMLKYNQKTPIMRIPTWIFMIWYVIGSGFYIIRVVLATIERVKEVFKK